MRIVSGASTVTKFAGTIEKKGPMPTPPGEQVVKCPECGSYKVGRKPRPMHANERGWGPDTFDDWVTKCADCGTEFALPLPGETE